MPHPAKPGVDWPAIQAERKAGATYQELADKHGLRKQSIYERAFREGWADIPEGVVTKKKWLAKVEKAGITVDGRCYRRNTEKAAIILKEIARGVGRDDAASIAGMTRQTLFSWMRDDPAFRELVEQAECRWAATATKDIYKAGRRGDWRAHTWLLGKRRPGIYGEKSDPGGMDIKVIINVPRGEPIQAIDVTPERLPEPQ